MRRALSAAIDRRALSQRLFAGEARPTRTVIPTSDGAGTAAPPGGDPAAARRFLAEAGYGPQAPLSLTLRTPDGQRSLPNDWVLALTGYRPSYPLLSALGIEARDDVCRTPVYDPATHETNRPGVYLAGTVCGGLDTSRWFIENGREHARHVMDHAAQSLSVAA